MKKNYNSSPLPFRGQKRYYIKRFKSVLNECKDIDIIVDLFGGSGLLSRVAKDQITNARVIYNDFDYFCNRVVNIPQTNELCEKIAVLTNGLPIDKKIPEDIKKKILELMCESDTNGFCDYITLSASLLFSGNWATDYESFAKQTFYNRSVSSHYDARSYFDGLEITHEDYRSLFARFSGNKKVLFLIDPPYLQTDCSSYKSDNFWSLKDYLDVISILKYSSYIFFTSGKSQIIDLCEWINSNFDQSELLADTQKWEQNSRVNSFSSYKDIMITKIVQNNNDLTQREPLRIRT